MKKPKSLIKPSDVKLGSEEMLYWKNLIDSKEKDLKITQENLKFYKFIVKYAKEEYERAEKEFNK